MRVAVVFLALACGGSTPAIHGPGSDGVTILEPGTMPRRQVRYAFAPGHAEDLELVHKTSTTTELTNTVLETTSSREDSPRIRVIRSARVDGVTSDGADVVVTVKEATILDAVDVGVKLRADLDKLRATKSSWRVSPTGRRTTTGDRWGVETPAVVFPDAEIGVGARWQVRTRERIGGAMWDQTVKFRLRDLTDSTASVDIEVIRIAAEQALHVEPTRTISLTSGTSRTTATTNVSLRGFGETGTGHEVTEIGGAFVQKALRISSKTRLTNDYATKPLARP